MPFETQGIGVPAVRFLKKYAINELIVEDNFCCGIAETYGFKKEKYELSMKNGSSLFDDIRSYTPSMVITDCGTCAIQINQATGIEVIHPIVLLKNSLGL